MTRRRRRRSQLPTDEIFNVSNLQFGSKIKENGFLVEWDSDKNSFMRFSRGKYPAKLMFDLEKYNLIIYFYVGDDLYKAQSSFILIKDKILFEGKSKITLTVTFSRNPLLWVVHEKCLHQSYGNPLDIMRWTRTTEIASRETTDDKVFCSQLMKPCDQEAANWATWRLRLSSNQILYPTSPFQVTLARLIEYDLVERSSVLKINPIVMDLTRFRIQLPNDLTFSRFYLVECLVSNNFINLYQLDIRFFKLIQRSSYKKLERIVGIMFSKNQFIPDPIKTFKEELEKPVTISQQEVNDTRHTLVRRVIITPSKIYFFPPAVEESNRVLRQFHHVRDRFIRVDFCDEEFNPIYANFELNRKVLLKIQDTLTYGFDVAQRHYNFLIFSSSQLREHSCWFFSDSAGYTGDLIRSWMGDFSDIKVTAKYAARMGQCFSSSRDGSNIGMDGFKLIRDIKAGNNLLTDGVGKISQLKMSEIAKELNLKVVPSVIQFRMGGFKGVLSTWPDLPPLPIYLRPSQQKFNSDHSILEVIRVSSFSTAYLNRQIILLLSTLGVKDSVFLELQNEMLNKVKQIKTDPVAALPFLTQIPDSFGQSNELIKLIHKRFFYSADRFVKNCLEVHFAYANNELKTRARIHVPKGAHLLGVADETGTLAPNEIFIQYSNPTKRNRTSRYLGECIVTRNPCFHPGDIRVVTAVDVPGLHHLVNCVVFSTKGTQSIPSMCSGGDLDGDDFIVIWDERLIPPHKNLPPMKHLAVQPPELNRVRVPDVKKFFSDYIESDNLGRIANAHLAWSDQLLGGAKHKKCLKLAQLHSRAVDFVKTGVPAEFNKEFRPTKFPDFMDKELKVSYKSEKILGQLFRSLEYVCLKRTEINRPDVLLHVSGFSQYLDEAYHLKEDYNEMVQNLMDQYGIENELEVITGCILKYREMLKERKYEVRRLVLKAYQDIKKLFLCKFNDEFKRLPLSRSDMVNRMQRKAYAWYYAAYTSNTMGPEPELESFAWIAQDHLLPIRLNEAYSVPSTLDLPSSDPITDHLVSSDPTPHLHQSLPGHPLPVDVDELGDLFVQMFTSGSVTQCILVDPPSPNSPVPSHHAPTPLDVTDLNHFLTSLYTFPRT